jgi:hypothetical protein
MPPLALARRFPGSLDRRDLWHEAGEERESRRSADGRWKNGADSGMVTFLNHANSALS